MGTCNFTPYTRQLDVLTGSSVHQFDVEAYNADADTPIEPDDWALIGEIVNFYTDCYLSSIYYDAKARRLRRSTVVRGRYAKGKKYAVSVLEREYDDSWFINQIRDCGTPLFTINTEFSINNADLSATLFVYAKSGYYEGVQIVQNLLLEDEYERFEIEVPCNESLDSCAEELEDWITEHKYVSWEMAAYLRRIGHIGNVLKDAERVLMDEYAQIVGPYVEGYRLVGTFNNGEALYERV